MSEDGPGYVVFAVLGFDERPILHCMFASKARVERVVLIQAETGDRMGEERSERVYQVLSEMLKRMNIVVEKRRLKPQQFLENIVKMARLLEERLGGGRRALIVLSTGMRPLILALYTATLYKYSGRTAPVEVCIEPEGMPESTLILPLSLVTAVADLIRDEKGLKLLEALMSSPEGLTLGDIHRATGLPRSTLYRLLNQLAEKGVVEKVEGKLYRLRIPYKTLEQTLENPATTSH